MAIENINVPWEGHSGKEVEDFIKGEIGQKYGHIETSYSEETTFYSLLCFASESDAEKYKENPEEYTHLLLNKVEVPIPTKQGNVYTAKLSSTISSTNNLVVTDNKLNVPLNYQSVLITPDSSSNAGETGTLVIERRTGTTDWAQVAELKDRLVSQDNDSVYEPIDLTEYLIQGKQQIRVRAIYSYITEDGEEKVVRSNWVMIGADITKTKLELTLATEYTTPIEAWKSTGEQNPFEVKYLVFGAVNKTLKIEVKGSENTNVFTDTFTDDGIERGISIAENEFYGYLTHGVREVRAWLEASDGMGGTLKSEELVNQFMVVNEKSEGYDATRKYFLLQNLETSVTNYVQTAIAEYAVYAPDRSKTELRFQLTDSKDSPYYELKAVAEHMKSETLLATVEIEPDSDVNIPEYYATRFYVFRDNTINFLMESVGIDYMDVTVDNSKAIIPIAGATFKLNPKTRNNDEADPKVIYNEKAGNAVVHSEWINFGFINDGWITDENNQKVLRIMAGERLVISHDIWKQFRDNPASSMTFDIDYKVSNVTNLTDPIVDITGGTNKGLRLNALDGWIKTASYNVTDDCKIAWKEDKRVYLSLNIHHAVRPNIGLGDVRYLKDKEAQANGTIALARVLINGSPAREIPFNKEDINEFCDGESSIIIGNDGADIDIYSMTHYEKRQIEWKDLARKNRIASLPTSEEKQKEADRNDIFDGTGISLEKCKEKGLNCIVYHSKIPYYSENAAQRGYVEYFRYDQYGKELKEYSGTNCRTSFLADLGQPNAIGGLEQESQGTTAESYWDFNLQSKSNKVKAYVDIPVSMFHENIHVRIDEEEGKAYIYGGNLGDLEPFEPTEKAYAYANGYVHVPDGWIDGNGKYRGLGYQVAPNTAQALKNVNKINYASSLQSHLLGACKSYDELHFDCVGASPLQKSYIKEGLQRPVSAKHLEPFMIFNQETENGTPRFIGLGTYGAGKNDSVAWGYVEDLHPNYALIEGSDNNPLLTNFLVPFDHKVTFNPTKDVEAWVYDNEVSWDYSGGATDDDGYPVESVTILWKRFHNFVYLNSTNITYFDGTLTEFNTAKKDTTKKYWLTSGNTYDNGGKRFCLFRYDKTTDTWVDAGMYDDAAGQYRVMDLRTDIRTAAIVAKYEKTTRYAEMNEEIIAAYADFMRKNGDYFISLQSLLFCYCYVLMFLNGSDNSAKNTYYKIDPIVQNMSAQGATAEGQKFASWYQAIFGEAFDFTQVYQIFMDGDDMDSIFELNNEGRLTKPYYIERLYPCADGSTVSLFEGINNQLFNLVEKSFTQEEREKMMYNIMDNMTKHVSDSDELLGLESQKVSVWGFLHKYFFNTQYYFPQVAYIEQARIRYEFAELMGHRGARGVRPISQSIGNQLDSEQQFMEQRLVYMASFAGYGHLGDLQRGGAIGLGDTEAMLDFKAAGLPDGSPATIELTVTPHQYIYPYGYNGTSTMPTHQRTSPKQTCKVLIATGVLDVTDQTMGLRGANYYSDYGNLGTLSTTSNVTVVGKRLTRLTISSPQVNKLRGNLDIQANNIQKIDITWWYKINSSFDFSSLIRLEELTVSGSYAVFYKIPKTHTFKTANIDYSSAYIENVELEEVPNLQTFTFFRHDKPSSQSLKKLKRFVIGNNVGTNTGLSFKSTIEVAASNKAPLETLIVKNIGNPIDDKGWSNLDANVMEWLADIPTCELKGTISIKEDDPYKNPRITWDLKNKINAKFGCVDNSTSSIHKGLLLSYLVKPFDASNAKIIGNYYVESGDTFKFMVKPQSVYENSHYQIKADISKRPNVTYCTLSEDGTLRVIKLSNSYDEMEILMYVDEITPRYKRNTIYKTIEIWNRPAQIGDLVYADGTFSSAETYEEEKTPIGICFYVPPRDNNGNVMTKYANPDDKQLRLMAALEETVVPINGGTTSSLQWGAQLQNGNQTPEWNKQNALYHLDGASNMVNLTSSKGFNVYDIQDIRNLTSSGMDNAYIDPLRVPKEGEAPFDYLDNSDEASFNYGFKCIAPDNAVGDGFAYDESQVSFNSVGERTLTSELAKLAGSGYKEGDIVNSGYAKTLKVIAHRNSLLSNNIIGADGEVIYTGGTFSAPSADSGKTEMKVLGELIDKLRNWATNSLQDPYPEKWQQLAYPFASACYAYEPTPQLLDGAVLADKFKAHNWFAPTEGLLARICWYAKFADKVDGSDPFKVAREKGLLRILTTSSSNHWSVTEANSTYSWGVYFGSGNTYYSYESNRMVGMAVSAF